MATEPSGNFAQIKRLYISILCVSIAFYVLVMTLSIVFHYQEKNLGPFIIVLVLGLSLRLIALFGATRELYGLTIGFAVIMSFFIVFSFIDLTVGSVHPMNIVGFFLHSATTLLAFMFAHKIRVKQLKQLATVVFCSPSVPALMNGNPQSYSSPTSLTAPVQVNLISAMQNIVPPELDLPPKYEQAIHYPKLNQHNQRV